METNNSKKVKYSDWMGDSSENEQSEEEHNRFDKKEYEGKKGHLLL